MFSKIKAFFVGVEQTVSHDVEAIITNFTSTVDKLEAAAIAKTAEAADYAATAEFTTKLSNEATAAAAKATAVAAKIKALVA
ncbi:hypothetical protein [Bradyrhizobium lupini]|uniref:hypothetical protein n=1 Tax=Rhizobium lupini TaxID=136996 RepID=UPI0034C67F92